ncbi:hypothetical protein NQ318_010350, partial [Aromia moschata]
LLTLQLGHAFEGDRVDDGGIAAALRVHRIEHDAVAGAGVETVGGEDGRRPNLKDYKIVSDESINNPNFCRLLKGFTINLEQIAPVVKEKSSGIVPTMRCGTGLSGPESVPPSNWIRFWGSDVEGTQRGEAPTAPDSPTPLFSMRRWRALRLGGPSGLIDHN